MQSNQFTKLISTRNKLCLLPKQVQVTEIFKREFEELENPATSYLFTFFAFLFNISEKIYVLS